MEENRVLMLRKALNMTLKDFSLKIGMSLSGLSEVEHGRSAITERLVRLILAAFPQVSEAWLRTGEGEMFRATKAGLTDMVSRLDLPDIAKTFVEVYTELPEDAQAIVLDYAHKVIADLMSRAGANAQAPDPEEEALKRGILDQLEAEKNQRATSPASLSGDTSTA